MPAATAMSEMPAVTLIVRIAVSRYHCFVCSASLGVKSRDTARRWFSFDASLLLAPVTSGVTVGLRKTDVQSSRITR